MNGDPLIDTAIRSVLISRGVTDERIEQAIPAGVTEAERETWRTCLRWQAAQRIDQEELMEEIVAVITWTAPERMRAAS